MGKRMGQQIGEEPQRIHRGLPPGAPLFTEAARMGDEGERRRPEQSRLGDPQP